MFEIKDIGSNFRLVSDFVEKQIPRVWCWHEHSADGEKEIHFLMVRHAIPDLMCLLDRRQEGAHFRYRGKPVGAAESYRFIYILISTECQHLSHIRDESHLCATWWQNSSEKRISLFPYCTLAFGKSLLPKRSPSLVTSWSTRDNMECISLTSDI